MVTKMIYIYKLIAPNGKIYVGQTSDIKGRFDAYKHLWCIQQPKLYNSLQKYGWNNFKNEILESTSEDSADDLERFWIAFYNCIGNGLNCNSGGNKNKKVSEETKLKMSESQKGRVFTEEHKRNMSIAQYNMSDENKRNKKIRMHEMRIGKTLSDVTKRKMSISHKGMIFTDEHKKNMSKSKLGKVHTDESKRKMSESAKGRIFSDDTRKRLSESAKRRKQRYYSDKSKLKMSVSAKIAWLKRKQNEHI